MQNPRRPSLSLCSSLSDPFVLEIVEKFKDSLSSSPSIQSLSLQHLHNSSQSLLSRSWPSSKDEPFRFADTSFLKNSSILPAPIPPLLSFSLDSPSPNLISLVHGHFATTLSHPSSLPAGAFTESLFALPPGPIYDCLLAATAFAAIPLVSPLGGEESLLDCHESHLCRLKTLVQSLSDTVSCILPPASNPPSPTAPHHDSMLRHRWRRTAAFGRLVWR